MTRVSIQFADTANGKLARIILDVYLPFAYLVALFASQLGISRSIQRSGWCVYVLCPYNLEVVWLGTEQVRRSFSTTSRS